ncbi:hypothetical protein QZH41_016355, partial [Actinostola sp. cb2023]
MFDKNGDGHITIKELGEAMAQAGQPVPESELKDMIRAVDVNGNGKIEYKEFEQMMAAQLGAPMSPDDIKYYFKQFDKNGDGFISGDEMRCLVRTFHSSLTGPDFDKLVKNMIDTADINKDGKISFD